jgi:hypothetical protein
MTATGKCHGDSSQFKPCKVNHLTTRHTWVAKTPWVAIVHDVIKESGQVLPRPSVVFHASASVDNPLVAWTLSHVTSISEVRYCLTRRHTKPVHNQTCSLGPGDRFVIDTDGGYHRRRSEHDNRPLPDLPIQYSPLSPSCPTRCHIKPFYQLIIFSNHSIHEPGY